MTREQANSHLLITRKQYHPDAPRPVTPIGIGSLDDMIGKDIRVFDNKSNVHTGKVLDWKQIEWDGEVTTFLFVALASWRTPQAVHWSRFAGFMNPFMGVR